MYVVRRQERGYFKLQRCEGLLVAERGSEGMLVICYFLI